MLVLLFRGLFIVRIKNEIRFGWSDIEELVEREGWSSRLDHLLRAKKCSAVGARD